MIDAYASESHYLAHLLPVWQALPRAERGHLVVASGKMQGHCEALGVTAVAGFLNDHPTLTLVAGARDFQWVSEARPLALLEHGAGQTYVGADQPHYAGGYGRERVAVFLCPREEVAERNWERYPNALHAVVGCPKLDRYLLVPPPSHENWFVVSAHWDGGPVQECQTTWWLYRHVFAALRDWGYQLRKHAHPRFHQQIADDDVTAHVPMVDDFDTVLRHAGAYVVDNSSTAYEFAALGKPVLSLNAPWYRRDVHHGLRFWDKIPGPQVDDPRQLPTCLDAMFAAEDYWGAHARTIARQVYDVLDGTSSVRAAQACLERA